MEIIGALILEGRCLLVEVDYLLFIMDLEARIDDDAKDLRPGLEVLGEDKAQHYWKFMENFEINEAEINADYESIPREDRESSRVYFLPSVSLDFDRKRFRASHPEAGFLNLRSYLVPGWSYEECDEVHSSLPIACPYWEPWGD